MSKKIGILSIIVSIFALIFAFALFGRIKDDYGDLFSSENSSGSQSDASVVIDENNFQFVGFSAKMSTLPESALRCFFKISEDYFNTLLAENSDTEIGILMVSERYLGDGKILEYSTNGTTKTILNDMLSRSTADETGFIVAVSDVLSVSSLTEEYYAVGYVKQGEHISYTNRYHTNVTWILEQEYLDLNSSVDKSTLLPYLSEEFKDEHGISDVSELINVTVEIGGELSSAVGTSLLECFCNSLLFIGDKLYFNGESATVSEYNSDLGYYTIQATTNGFFYDLMQKNVNVSIVNRTSQLYPLNTELTSEERLTNVRLYYEKTYTNETERFNSFKNDTNARDYLGDLYAPLWELYSAQANKA